MERGTCRPLTSPSPPRPPQIDSRDTGSETRKRSRSFSSAATNERSHRRQGEAEKGKAKKRGASGDRKRTRQSPERSLHTVGGKV
ncbi:hypothetical protein Bca4012_036833 [Brassica carinata]|uniref:Uncharacterized protein n=1 Tax=Brassica carinata TaxID=52824 RepID=A0A8X7WEN8_BRACI|nr:hypothetical protein Bca52824_010543 [Brassica carinata]